MVLSVVREEEQSMVNPVAVPQASHSWLNERRTPNRILDRTNDLTGDGCDLQYMHHTL